MNNKNRKCENYALGRTEMLTTTVNGVRNVIPKDSKTIAEEDAFKQPKRKETITVKLLGRVAEKITRTITAHETEISYSGAKYELKGNGFERYIDL